MVEVNFLSSVKKIKRNIEVREMKNEKIINISKKFSSEYFDGDRKYGYGGYFNDGRWKKVAKKIIDYYSLDKNSKILDVGCAKGFLVNELNLLGRDAYGIDISQYALSKYEGEFKKKIFKCNSKKINFPDNYFDLVISFNTIHNLVYDECKLSIKEIIRTSNNHKFIQVDAYENNEEKEEFLKWVLTAQTHGTPKFWLEMFKETCYDGDWYWTKV